MLRNSRERAGKDAMEGIGEKGSIVDFLVTRIAHFRFAYMTPFVRKLGTKRSSSPTVPFARVQDAGLVGEREAKKGKMGGKKRTTQAMRDACTRLQDEINTILCKRARLIARGKASGISGIPNKLTLNAEGSPLPPFHLREPRASSGASHLRFWMGERTTRRNIYRCPRNTRRIPISPNSYFVYTPLCRLGIEDDLGACSSEAMHSSAQMTKGRPRDVSRIALLFRAEDKFHLCFYTRKYNLKFDFLRDIVEWTQNINKEFLY